MTTLKQIHSRIEKLQAQAEALLSKRASVVIGKEGGCRKEGCAEEDSREGGKAGCTQDGRA
jgi:hypothetical protein